MATANLTVRIGRIEFFVRADFDVIPGEPMVRYYADGSGYPGSPPEIDGINSVECIECEWPMGWTDFDDRGNLVDQCDGWGYAAREDRPDAFAIADRWVWEELSSGAYDDELFAEIEGDDYDD